MKTVPIVVSVLCVFALILAVMAYRQTHPTVHTVTQEGFEYSYPFHPINPSAVNFIDTQSVYGLPGDLFKVGHTLNNTRVGAWRSLQVADDNDNLNRQLNIEWTTNSTHNFEGNSDFLLNLSQEPIGLWKNL